jgi:hypothetical protein
MITQKTNLDTLQEAIIAQAELLDLHGDEKGFVEGVVIESRNVTGLGYDTNVVYIS